MKKLLLLAALLGSVSFSGMAAGIAGKKQGKLVSQATQKATIHNANKLKELKPLECGWASYTIGCGGPIDFLGHAYVCSAGDLLYAKMTAFEMYCQD